MDKVHGKVIQGRQITVNTRLIASTDRNRSDAATAKLQNLFKSYTRCNVIFQPCTPSKVKKSGSTDLRKSAKLHSDKKLSNCGVENQSIGSQLLSAINDMFKVEKASKMTTRSILASLYEDSYKRSAFHSNGKRIGARRLNTILQNEFGLHSCDIRFASGVFKGFHRNAITEAWCQARKATSLSNSSPK